MHGASVLEWKRNLIIIKKCFCSAISMKISSTISQFLSKKKSLEHTLVTSSSSSSRKRTNLHPVYTVCMNQIAFINCANKLIESHALFHSIIITQYPKSISFFSLTMVNTNIARSNGVLFFYYAIRNRNVNQRAKWKCQIKEPNTIDVNWIWLNLWQIAYGLLC